MTSLHVTWPMNFPFDATRLVRAFGDSLLEHAR